MEMESEGRLDTSPANLDTVQAFNRTFVVNNVTTTVEMNVLQHIAKSNTEFIVQTAVELYLYAYEFVFGLTLWNFFQIGLVCFFCEYMLKPFIIYLSKRVKAIC